MKAHITFRRIQVPYKLSHEDMALIASSKGWSDDSVKPVRDRIRSHLGEQQLWRCAYCREPLPPGRLNLNHIEHIVDNKKKHRWSSFFPKNLALSCPTCNTYKQHNRGKLFAPSVMKLMNLRILPSLSTHYYFVHPYLDQFDAHLSLKKSWVYSAKLIDGVPDKKGLKHIEIFKLDKLWEVERRGRLARFSEPSGLGGQLRVMFSLGIGGDAAWGHLAGELRAVRANRSSSAPKTLEDVNNSLPDLARELVIKKDRFGIALLPAPPSK